MIKKKGYVKPNSLGEICGGKVIPNQVIKLEWS